MPVTSRLTSVIGRVKTTGICGRGHLGYLAALSNPSLRHAYHHCIVYLSVVMSGLQIQAWFLPGLGHVLSKA